MLGFLGLIMLLLFNLRSREHRTMKEERRRSREEALHRAVRLHRDHRAAIASGRSLTGHGLLSGLMFWKKGKNSGSHQWADPRMLPPLPHKKDSPNLIDFTVGDAKARKEMVDRAKNRRSNPFKVYHKGKPPMEWETEADELLAGDPVGPTVDYTKIEYRYPDVIDSPPRGGLYPDLERLGDIFKRWPQDELDSPPQPLVEKLQRFDFMNVDQREAALRFRDAELPFKLYNVPEIHDASHKWTDEYIASNFNSRQPGGTGPVRKGDRRAALAKGHCQQSKNNFFAFFTPAHWNIETMGAPPTLDNDWTFEKWAKHARYADHVGLPPEAEHFYWQSNIPEEERTLPEKSWTFVSRDLPSFSSLDPNFFSFSPTEQQGIQCRFGERGVTAATHYDAGRNMVAMITGAKRYILSPPNACGKLGIVTNKKHPAFRHSLLNFAHLNFINEDTMLSKSMPLEEREWLEVAGDSQAVETVLKAGEVLYIPSHWFHYITSLQKSAQCNVRSGIKHDGTIEFGGESDVQKCLGDDTGGT